MIRHISAVTFAVREMARSIEFYEKLGFELLYGGESAAFSTFESRRSLREPVSEPRIRAQVVGSGYFPSR